MIGVLAGSGDLNLGSQYLDAGENNQTTTYFGVLSGTGELRKSGTGTLTLTGNNTHTGGTIIDGGTIAPGASPGTLTLGDNLALESGSTLEIELGGLLQGVEYDFLDVIGDVTLGGGTLDVTLIDPFTPGIAQTFDILDFASLSGTFGQINLPTLDAGHGLRTIEGCISYHQTR